MASDDTNNSYRLNRHDKVIQPLPASERPEEKPKKEGEQPEDTSPAIELIRQKVAQMYEQEPNAKEEKKEVETLASRSKHQQFMYDLSHSGKPLAEIQTTWHNYYTTLPDSEKHQVWHEFYAAHRHYASAPVSSKPEQSAPADVQPKPASAKKAKPSASGRGADPRTVSEVKEQLVRKVAARAKHKNNPHIQSLAFGLSTGMAVILILLFGFFNERFIAPFVTPSRTLSSTPIILDPGSTAVGPEPKIIIPKINVEIPVVYDEPSIQEERVQAALERGVVHYATTPSPGEKGNAVIFGHSANNILNKGKYKFAFVLLKRLELNDTFYLHKDGKRYVYKVFDKKIVPPTDVSVLNPTSKPATATLITCDPPGTNTNRLVVIAEQVSPDPNANTASTAAPANNSQPTELPSSSPSLWGRFTDWIFN